MTAKVQRVSVAVLGSGAGSNAAALIDYSAANDASYSVDLVVATRGDAGIVSVAGIRHIPVVILPANGWQDALVSALRAHNVSVLALAGFLRKLPESVIALLDGDVLNIHPALLPKFGGHGMYGLHVHAAVIEAGEPITGATVHRVTKEYDEGSIIAQRGIDVEAGDDPKTLQDRVKTIEHTLYPEALDYYCRQSRGSSTPPTHPSTNRDPSMAFE